MGTIFPTLIVGSLIISSGLYVITPVKDREDKLRYLLNFTGISPAAYYLGFFAADCLIFIIPTILIFILSYILQVKTFTDHALQNFAALIMFGVSYIPLGYCTSFIFKKADSAFKYNISVMLAYTGVLIALPLQFDAKFFMELNYMISPFFNLF